MFKVLVILVSMVSFTAIAGTHTEVTKVPKPDTVISVKADTVKTVNYDTLVITKTFKDTTASTLIKTDTTVVKQKAAVAPAKAEAPAKAPAKAAVKTEAPVKAKGK